ncbi:MAG TPA: hypothetical protein VJH37_05250 [Candidatus Nanoarchaeia archaeon]|nr:hypothetical protein [Candidatus Nanoarchaeia archaeon]
MKNLSVIAKIAASVGGAVGSYYLLSKGIEVYHQPIAEPIKNSPFPLIGLGAGISQAFATSPEEVRNEKGWKHYTLGLALGTLAGLSSTAWRMWNGTDQYSPARLQGQPAGAQLLEDIVAVGATLGAMYAVTAVCMNIYEAASGRIADTNWYANRQQLKQQRRERLAQSRAQPVQRT